MTNKFLSGFRRVKNGVKLFKKAGKLSRSLLVEPENLDILISRINQSYSFRMSQKSIEIKALLQTIIDNKPKIIVEIGSFKGGTLCSFCQVAPLDSIVISVDINYPVERRLAHRRFVRPSQKARFIQGDSHSLSTLTEIRKFLNEEQVDLLFLDGDHSYDGIKKDFEMYADLVKPDGIIAIHDIYPDNFIRTGTKTASYVGGVPIYWKEIKNQFATVIEVIEEDGQDGFGLGILSQRKSTSARIERTDNPGKNE